MNREILGHTQRPAHKLNGVDENPLCVSNPTTSSFCGAAMLPLASSSILEMAPYVPGLSIGAAAKAYGLTNVIKLASNENPLGPSPKAMAAARLALANVSLYPTERRVAAKERVCERHKEHNFSPGAGCTRQWFK